MKLYVKKNYWVVLFLVLVAGKLYSQEIQPVSFTFVLENSKKGKDFRILIIKVNIEDDWYLYASDLDPDLGPQPTKITFKPDESYELIGKPLSIGVKEKFDRIWMSNVRILEKKGEFQQTIRILNNNPVIKGTIAYQTCSDMDGQCILGEEKFEISNKEDRFPIHTTNDAQQITAKRNVNNK